MEYPLSAGEQAVMWTFGGMLVMWAIKMLSVPMVTKVHGWRASTAVALAMWFIAGTLPFLVFAGAAVCLESLLWYLDPASHEPERNESLPLCSSAWRHLRDDKY